VTQPQPSDAQAAAIAKGQLRMAYRMTTEHRDTLRHVHAIGWHIWLEGCWIQDEKDTAMVLAIQTKINAMREIADLQVPADRARLLQDASRLDSAAGLHGTVAIAAALPPFSVGVSELDSNPYKFNMPNGIFDLRTGLLHPHDPHAMHTKVTGCTLEGARCNGPFDEFIREVLPDQEIREFAQRVIGYAALGEIRDQIFPIISGEGGTGKSTFLNIIRAAFGTYASVAPRTLLMNTGTQTQHPTEIARLRGQRLVIAHETEKGQSLKTAAMKSMTGGDVLTGHFMRKDFFDFIPSHTFMLVTNYPPVLDADDDAAWDRIKVIPFTQKFRGTVGEDTRLATDIIAEDLPSVLRWIVDGYAMYQREKLWVPFAITEATAAHAQRVDNLGQFLGEHTWVEPGIDTLLSAVYELWRNWASIQKIPVGRKNDFADRLEKRGYVLQKGRQTKVIGLKLDEGLAAYYV
jgi:putative DNA primase/helicase